MVGDDGKVGEAYGEHDVTEDKDEVEETKLVEGVGGYIVGKANIQGARLEL